MTCRFPWMDILIRRPSSVPSSNSYYYHSLAEYYIAVGDAFATMTLIIIITVITVIISGDSSTILIIILHYYYCVRGFVVNGTRRPPRDKVAVFKNSLFRCTVIVWQDGIYAAALAVAYSPTHMIYYYYYYIDATHNHCFKGRGDERWLFYLKL